MATPFAVVFFFWPLTVTLAPATGSPASVTLTVSLCPCFSASPTPSPRAPAARARGRSRRAAPAPCRSGSRRRAGRAGRAGRRPGSVQAAGFGSTCWIGSKRVTALFERVTATPPPRVVAPHHPDAAVDAGRGAEHLRGRAAARADGDRAAAVARRRTCVPSVVYAPKTPAPLSRPARTSALRNCPGTGCAAPAAGATPCR